jgi:hypothetical protein
LALGLNVYFILIFQNAWTPAERSAVQTAWIPAERSAVQNAWMPAERSAVSRYDPGPATKFWNSEWVYWEWIVRCYFNMDS